MALELKAPALVRKAPAKINWFLQVLGMRDDGYHEILSLMQSIDLCDTLTFENSSGLELISDIPLPLEENLVYRAALALRETVKTSKGARITLAKRIPLAAGLGGGSSDAATALVGLNSMWGLGLSVEELSNIGSRLGSDIPFFLNGPSAVVEGRGEKVAPARIMRSCTLLLVKPPFGVSAGRAYSEVRKYADERLDAGAMIEALNGGDYKAFGNVLRNDLEGPVFKSHPELSAIKKRLLEKGAVLSLMSGSGSTVFGAFENRRLAEEARAGFPSYWSAVADTQVAL